MYVTRGGGGKKIRTFHGRHWWKPPKHSHNLGPAFFTIPVDVRCEQISKITKRIPPTASDGHVQAGHLQDRRLHPRHHRHDCQPRRHRAPRQAGMGGIMVSPQHNGTLFRRLRHGSVWLQSDYPYSKGVDVLLIPQNLAWARHLVRGVPNLFPSPPLLSWHVQCRPKWVIKTNYKVLPKCCMS